MNEFVSAFTHVAATLDQLGIGYVVVGSVAASSWGAIRTTIDLERQWRDCFELAAINDLDLIHLRKWAPVLGVSDDLERLLGSIPD